MQYLKVNEIFYSIQGEGLHVGTPTIFIRLSGCNLKCKFCDTNFGKKVVLTPEEILERIKNLNTDVKDICLTGGEPLFQDIDPLVELLLREGYLISIETNGIYLAPDNCFITVSPKSLKCDPSTIAKADEIKFLCGIPNWEKFIFKFIKQFNLPTFYTNKFSLQPVWEDLYTKDKNTLKKALKFIYKNPWIRLSVQLHKYIGEK